MIHLVGIMNYNATNTNLVSLFLTRPISVSYILNPNILDLYAEFLLDWISFEMKILLSQRTYVCFEKLYTGCRQISAFAKYFQVNSNFY